MSIGAMLLAAVGIILLIVLGILIWVIGSYNGFVKLRNKTEEAFSALDISLKKRYDLIPNYVETVKGYAKYESETLEMFPGSLIAGIFHFERMPLYEVNSREEREKVNVSF